ncbi:MAG TPA: hypothetical protein VMY34_07985, partial [Acidimicrobiales bacterium]|nr:hypothetical protein [Acidimicrobiales bacterium]
VQLTGNDVGTLFGHYLLSEGSKEGERLVVSSIVSSPMLGAIAAAHGAKWEETLTGFKWIANRGLVLENEGYRFVFGYEEALGYSIGGLVRDKDGVSAALIATELASHLKASGQAVLDRLAEIFRTHGAHVTRQWALRLEGADWLDRVTAAMAAIRARPPEVMAERRVQSVEDLLPGGRLPSSDVLIFTLDGARLVIRPSGTEAKVKCYAEAVEIVAPGDDVWASRARASATVDDVLDAAAALLTSHGV